MTRHLLRRTLGLAVVLIAVLGFTNLSNGQANEQGIWRVNIADDGTESDGGANGGYLSHDGRFVGFPSEDTTTLVPGATGDQVYLRDRLTNQITVVSVDSNGNPGTGGGAWDEFGGLSRDNRYVCFVTDHRNIDPGDNDTHPDVFVTDRQNGSTTRVSVDSNGEGGNAWCTRASISEDGRYVLFNSGANDLVPDDTNALVDLFLHDRQTSTTTRVNLTSSGDQSQGGGAVNGSVFLPDLQIVVFGSDATNLVTGDTNRNEDIFVRDLVTGAVTRVSVDSAGVQGKGDSFWPSVSADGNLVFFASYAANLVPNDNNRRQDVFVHDRRTGVTTLVSVDASGTQGDGDSRFSSSNICSADGRFVCFQSSAQNFPGDTTAWDDVLVKDLATGELRIVTRNRRGRQANKTSWAARMSRDGRFQTFLSAGSNLVPQDNNGIHDVFVVGPHLTLEADPETVAAGDSLVLTTWTGEPFGRTLLAAVAVNGAPTFATIYLSAFDASGQLSLSSTVPTGLAGNTLTLQAFGTAPTGWPVATNQEILTFK